MKPPALEIRLMMISPELGWQYVATLQGRPIAHGNGFAQPGEALVAAVAEVKLASFSRRETSPHH